MTTQTRRPGGETPATPAPFSYAQAAKGLSTTGPSASSSVSQASGRTSPSADAVASPTAAPTTLTPSVPDWAEDAEAEDVQEGRQTVSHQSKPTTTAVESLASSETTAKDDDVASLPNASSESASNWENKSQASTSVEKSPDRGERRATKGKGKNAEKVPIKPLQEAPIPAVNPWSRRADEMKAKAAQKAAPKSAANSATGLPANGTAVKKSVGPATNGAAGSSEKGSATEAKSKPSEDEKAPAARNVKPEVDADRAKRGGRNRPSEKDSKQTTTPLPLPPHRDEESWPTPENALDEERRKSQAKGEKPETERKESSSGRGKKEWVPIPHTPTVVFTTPLPNTMSSRRGGRGGGRGGAQGNGRGGSFVGNSEKETSAVAAMANGDGSKRGRPESTTVRDQSHRDVRTSSAGATAQNGSKSSVAPGDKNAKVTNGPDNESLKASSIAGDANQASQPQGHSNTFPRPNQQTRPGKGRRGDFVPQGDKRKDGEITSPTNDTFPAHDRQPSSAMNANGKPFKTRSINIRPGITQRYTDYC
jgi:la-related protein 1